MFEHEISLWAGGPVLTLGGYFVAYRYLLSFFVLAWTLCLLYRPGARTFFFGALMLASFSWIAFDKPLERPYGLEDRGIALEELAEPMVASVRRSSKEGALVGAPNRWPFWSLLVSLGAGFDPARLLGLYAWLPLVALLLLGSAIYVGLGVPSVDTNSVDRMVPALAVFFVLFLSVPRLSFLETGGGTLWPELFWLRPRLAIGLAVALIALGRFARAESVLDFVVGGLGLGIASWIEPCWSLLGGAGVFVWAMVQWRLRDPVWRSAVGLLVAAGVSLAWSSRAAWESSITQTTPIAASWYALVQNLFAVSLDHGIIFYLAVLAATSAFRRRRRLEIILVSWLATGYAFWLLVCIFPQMARLVDPALAKSFLRVLLAANASLGAQRLLVWIDDRWNARPPSLLRGRSPYAVAVAALVALSLPWTFPFWWNPIRMDRLYVQSIEPVPQEHQTFANWIRDNTSADAVFAAGPSYASWIPALSGRRVLLSDEGATVPRLGDREQAFEWVTGSENNEKIRAGADAWGITHIAGGRLDAEVESNLNFEFMRSSPDFALVYQQRRWVRVFELRP